MLAKELSRMPYEIIRLVIGYYMRTDKERAKRLSKLINKYMGGK